MSLLKAWKGVARQIGVANAGLSRMARRISDATDEAENLEQAIPSAPLILGPDGKPFGGGGGPQPQYPTGSFFGSSVAPSGPTTLGGATPSGMPDMKGRSMKLGGGKSAGSEGGGEGGTKGIKSVETNRDKIGAIIDAAGVSAPAKEDWNENGTGPGEFAGFIISTVLQLGTSAPQRFLVWCAGWLAYSAAATEKKMSSTASRHGGGYKPGQLSEFRKWLYDRWANQTGPQPLPPGWQSPGGGGGSTSEAPPGFTTSGGGGEAWAQGLPGGGSDNSGGSWTGGSAMDTLAAATGKSVSEGVSKANEPVVDGINKMVDQMTKLNASLQSDGGLRYRTGGVS